MANRDGREALRGAEVQTFDLLAKVLTQEQWAAWLKVLLEHAAATGDRGLAQKLVGAGAEAGDDALHIAVDSSHEEIVRDLLENGASVAARNRHGDTPLHLAARAGNTEMVQVLLLKGADINALSHGGFSALYYAVHGRHVSVVLALLAAGADVSLRYHYSERSIVHEAVDHDVWRVDILRAVIEHGADVQAADTADDETPLYLAASRNNDEAIDVLAEAGANIEGRDEVGGATPLHVAAGEGMVYALEALLKHGARVNTQDMNQDTPLHWATVNAGKDIMIAEVVDALLRSGADETILDAEGQTPADVVPEEANEEDELAGNLNRVRELLARAPADRAWRRRGCLVLCRAHPARMQQVEAIGSAISDVAPRTRSGAKQGRTETSSFTRTAGGSMADGRTGGDWAAAMGRVLGLQEEGIFRTIVGYL